MIVADGDREADDDEAGQALEHVETAGCRDATEVAPPRSRQRDVMVRAYDPITGSTRRLRALLGPIRPSGGFADNAHYVNSEGADHSPGSTVSTIQFSPGEGVSC